MPGTRPGMTVESVASYVGNALACAETASANGAFPRDGNAMRIAALALAFGLALTASGTARAQTDDYPSRTVTFICPFPAGGGTDILVRLLAAELQDKLKRPVVVDNRVGAATKMAANAGAKSPPDGSNRL